jgi:L,D-transpeptidase ErfK/SrfK
MEKRGGITMANIKRMAFVLGILFCVTINPAFAKNFGAVLCKKNSQFSCYTVKKHETWQKLFADDNQRDLIMRINRMNTKLHRGMVIALPKTNDSNVMDYSPLPKQIDPPGEKFILVSIHNLAFGAYGADGKLVYWGPVSTGQDYCSDIHRGCHTSLGKFAIYEKEGPGCVSTKFPVGKGGAPMPYCMYFHKGYALHGSPEVPGYNASHGCVRMFVADAKWLNREFTTDEPKMTVIIKK